MLPILSLSADLTEYSTVMSAAAQKQNLAPYDQRALLGALFSLTYHNIKLVSQYRDNMIISYTYRKESYEIKHLLKRPIFLQFSD